jgi:hypothetical protein
MLTDGQTDGHDEANSRFFFAILRNATKSVENKPPFLNGVAEKDKHKKNLTRKKLGSKIQNFYDRINTIPAQA